LEHADVLVVGAGASGGVVVGALAEAGFDVVCLEQGHWPDRAEFPALRPTYELEARKPWMGNPTIRGLPPSLIDYWRTTANAGLLIRSDNEGGGLQHNQAFDSSENGTASWQPTLTLDVIPEPSTVMLSKHSSNRFWHPHSRSVTWW